MLHSSQPSACDLPMIRMHAGYQGEANRIWQGIWTADEGLERLMPLVLH